MIAYLDQAPDDVNPKNLNTCSITKRPEFGRADGDGDGDTGCRESTELAGKSVDGVIV